MGLFPEFFGVEHFAADARPRRSDARAALMFACALVLGAVGSLGPLAGPAFARGPESLADLADAVSDAVVNISATQTMDDKHAENAPQLEPGTPFDDLFEEFFRRHQQGAMTGKIKNNASANRIRSAPASSSIHPGLSSPTITSSPTPTR